MFNYLNPRFQKDHILRTEMLDLLRDYPKDFLELCFSEYGNGIVAGCEVTWGMGKLSISPGILCRSGTLYFLKETEMIDCNPQNRQQYLKVEFLTEEITAAYIAGNTRLALDSEETDPRREQELCRFHFQNGARLRSNYESFEDFSTEFDTVNQTHVPYSIKGGETLKPSILIRFAEEMMKGSLTSAYDISFAMQVLANHGGVSPQCINAYIKTRLEVRKWGAGVWELYDGLSAILKGILKNGTPRKEPMENKRIILM